ncbi:MAG TPA: CAP domain-containing protein [Opitutaceae bacterium]|nr:CAP domain-containing protein [Opitutaceae bacterium]HRJ46892.1 CAP domain-containing protein [Opitutaceae bacterium]
MSTTLLTTPSRHSRFPTGKRVGRPFRAGAIWLVLALFSPSAWAEPHIVIDRDGLSTAILAETNRERVARGLQPLKPDLRLDRAADGHTKFLVLVGGLRHRSFLPGRETLEDRVLAEGLRASALSENLGLLPIRPPAIREDGERQIVDGEETDLRAEKLAVKFVRAWLDSPRHRANLLSPNFTHLGSAVQTGLGPAAVTHVYSTQVFARL